MDPTTCYLCMLMAQDEGNLAEARQYALQLAGWLRKGGFYPKGYAQAGIDAAINGLLIGSMDPDVLTIPFGSLVCAYCDNGMEIENLGQAVGTGWTRIQNAGDLPNATHLGVCPECQDES